ncbi:hypothetical protein NMG60_11015606 [Bertholletia excelsa]
MAPAGKVSGFRREGNDWFCNAGLPSDISIAVDGATFHLHKFPLTSKCGKIIKIVEESQNTHEGTFTMTLEGFPGGPDYFLLAAKYCYGIRSEAFFHKSVLQNWKDCILALQSCEPVLTRADELQIISKCLNAVSMMVCTDPSLFGWPMMMYGSLQSPGGSILWNGINTGAKIQSSESDWWFEDISYLSMCLFERLIHTMEERGIRPEKLAGAIMYYAKKYLPGLGRWQGIRSTKTRTVASFSMTPAAVDQRVLLESVIKLLPKQKGKSFCRFLLGLLRVSLILSINDVCQDSLERRIGMQLELADLDCLLIPSYSDSDTLYNTDCIERIIHHFTSSEPCADSISPPSFDLQTSPSPGPLQQVASDVNLKPGKLCALAESLPESSRSLHDGLYRALDIYFKAHPWLPEKEKEQLCRIVNFQKLSIDACAHASQNERLPLRAVLQVLFFEQLQLRTALAGCLHVIDAENAPAGPTNIPSETAGQRDGRMSVAHENQVFRMDMENMRSKVGELEEEFGKIKQVLKKLTKTHSFPSSPRFFTWRMGCKLLPHSTDPQAHRGESMGATRASVEQAPTSGGTKSRKSFSLF